MVRGIHDDEFCGDFYDDPEQGDADAVTKEVWREYRRQARPEMTDAECDADWRKHLKGSRR